LSPTRANDRICRTRSWSTPWRWTSSTGACIRSAPDALLRTVHLSYGDVPARHYLTELSGDLAIHAWDLAKGIDAEERLDPDLAQFLYDWTLPHAEALSGSGAYAPPKTVSDEAPVQDRLLGLTGRDPSWAPGT
jgi:uncharacterized protein (TIGR03086 family)